MSGVMITIDVRGLGGVERKLARLSSLNHALILEAGGATIESQTRRRIESEKIAPDGTPWKKNRTGTPILVKSGHLLASIHYVVGGDEVRTGSGLVYAAIHQFGGTIVPKNGGGLAFPGIDGGLVIAKSVTIPARTYLGVSAENAVELRSVLVTTISRMLH